MNSTGSFFMVYLTSNERCCDSRTLGEPTALSNGLSAGERSARSRKGKLNPAAGACVEVGQVKALLGRAATF